MYAYASSKLILGASRFFLCVCVCVCVCVDRLCGLVVRVSGYRYRGLGFDSRRYQIFWVVVGLDGVHSASWGQLRSYLNKK